MVTIKDGRIYDPEVLPGEPEGRRIVAAWESFSGWYWFATEVDGDTCFGFVVGLYPEWGYFSRAEIKSLGPLAWRILKRDLPIVHLQVGPEGIIRIKNLEVTA